VRTADGRAACRANVGYQAIKKHDLAIEQYNSDLRPVFRVCRSSPATLSSNGLGVQLGRLRDFDFVS